MSRVFISSLSNGYAKPLGEGLQWLGCLVRITPSHRILIKPNLTFPVFRAGVMTNPELLEALIVHLKDYSDNITICESDSGGYNRFSMDEVFRASGILEIARRYGVRIVNMSREHSQLLQISVRGKNLSVPLPTIVLNETDLFITVPVPKVHSNTIVSLAIKNQWGIIQEPSLRLKLHPYFKQVVYHVNKSLPPTISIVDGKYGLTRNGPMRGDVVNLNWLLLSDNLYCSDYVCCKLMGIEPQRIPYLKYIFENEGLRSLEDVEFNQDYQQFITPEPFYLKREWTDYPGFMTFHSRLLAYVGYRSPLAKPLHWLLYKFREPFYDTSASEKQTH